MQADDTSFSGIIGTTTAAPTGSAEFEGRYTIVTPDAFRSSAPVTFNYDFDAKTLKMTDITTTNSMVISATVSDDTLSGTATYDGVKAELDGGFYGTEEVAGAFNGGTAGGVFYGTK